MTHHRGRLIDHVHLRARDLPRTRAFYEAALAALDRQVIRIGEHAFTCDELWVDAADAATVPTRIHLAFQAAHRAMVDRFYASALAAGGIDNGAPGERPYHPGYYGAFVLDPDGNNIEAVFHGPNRRSAESVEIDEVR